MKKEKVKKLLEKPLKEVSKEEWDWLYDELKKDLEKETKMSKLKLKVKCKKCNGTGLYVGMAERDGAAVVCNNCHGTGCYEYEYEKFTKRIERAKIKRVYEANPGITIGSENNHRLEDFGGMSYDEWKKGKKFKPGMENRKYTCPAWWYNVVNYIKRPKWKECYNSPGSLFSQCKFFPSKDKCWKRYDAEKDLEKEDEK
jgi:hypothetical protein